LENLISEFSWNSLGIPLGKSLGIYLGNQALSKSAFVHSPQKGETCQKTFTSKKILEATTKP